MALQASQGSSLDTQDVHLARLNNLLTAIEPWHDKFISQYDQLKSLKEGYLSKLERFSKEEQTLNISIMGQVKAGKSSFLNALLFDGKPILPEASTPKTANLTRISYAEKPTLSVEFYSPQDWARIKDLANSDFEHQEAKVAKEQVSMIVTAGIDVDALIAQGEQQHVSDNLDDIMNVLNYYAGNDGKYTGIVKMICLYLPLPELIGYNIIDTPGMNDPVVSRTQRTKEEMENSDVVFFLSRASNFLDASDIDLLSKQLPEAGVKRLVLVAGQYDSAIEQDGYDRSSLLETEKNLYQRIIKRAQADIAKLAQDKEQAGMPNVAKILRSMTVPVCSSTYAYGFANWEQSKWNKNMSHAYQNIMELAEDEWSETITKQDWQRIAGFEPLRQAYEQAKADKEKIINEQKKSLLPEAVQNLQNWEKEFVEQINQRILTLEEGDMAKVEQRQQYYQSKIMEISSKLEQVIGISVSDARKRQIQISHDLKNSIAQHVSLKARTGTETYEEPSQVSNSKWYNPFSWGSTITVYKMRTRSYDYISAADAVDQLYNYAYQCESDISYHFNQLVNPDDIKIKLKKALLLSLDTKSTDFDPTQFRNLMSQSIRQLDIPELSLNIGDIGGMIGDSFDSEIRQESDKVKLKQQLNNALREIFKLLNKEFEVAVEQVASSLEVLQNTLEARLTETLQTEVKQLKADMQDKQAMIDSYQSLVVKLI